MHDAVRFVTSPIADDSAGARLIELVAAIQSAKVTAAAMYSALADRMPSVESGLAVRRLAEDEMEHAARLLRLVSGRETAKPMAPPVAPGCGLHDEGWPSALMAAFALDQAATAALTGIGRPGQGPLVETAARIVEEERSHQAFAIAAFKSVSERDPAAGRRLAAEMLVARDWVKQVFPRHAALADLAANGVLPTDAAKVHDSFLASLGERVQETLGVLGD